MGVQGEERKQGLENLCKTIMIKNFPNLVKEIDAQVQEVQTVLYKMNPKRPMPRHIIIQMPKVKDKEF